MEFYVPSGKVSPRFLVFGLGAIAGALACGAIYDLVGAFVSMVWVNAFIAFFFAMGVSLLALLPIRVGHCRNRLAAWALALLVIVAGYSASYVTGFLRSVRSTTAGHPGLDFTQLITPAFFWEWINARVAGGWSINDGRHTLTGPIVVIVWGAEFALVVGWYLFMVNADETWNHPYCEACSEWTKLQSYSLSQTLRADVDQFIARANLESLLRLETPSAPHAGGLISMKRAYCPTCASSYLSVTDVTTVQAGSKTEQRLTVLLRHALLRDEQARRYLETSKRICGPET